MFSFLFFLVIFFFHAYFEQTISLFYAVPIEMRKKETNQSFVQKKKEIQTIVNVLWSQIVSCIIFFVCASVFNIFLKYSNSWMPFGYWKKRLDDVQKIWHKYGKTKQSRSEHTLAKKCWNKQKTIFFSAKTADQNHRYLHLEPNFYDNLSRSLATNASLKGNT